MPKYDPDAQLKALAARVDQDDLVAHAELKATMQQIRDHLDSVEGPDAEWVRLYESKATTQALASASKPELKKMLQEARKTGASQANIDTLVKLLNS